jgi:hypothetical protein
MDELYGYLNTLAAGKRLSPADKAAVPPLLDAMYALLEARRNPPGFRLASGEVAKGATGRIALNAYFLLLGRAAYGKDYARKDERFQYWQLYLGFYIMHGHFLGKVKTQGLYCCATCTLSMLPLYCMKVFPAFDNDQLKANVLKTLKQGSWPFGTKYSRKYEAWVRQFV